MEKESSLLALPQEIRDLIFHFAVREDPYDAGDVRDAIDYRMKRIPIGRSERWQWEAHHTSQAPIPEYLCLMLCNRQLNHELRTFLDRAQGPDRTSGKMTMLLEYPKLFTTWTQIPQSLSRIKILDLLIRVNHIFHPAYISQGAQNAILAAVSDTLKRYIYRGPHLGRPSNLRERLHLETVRITVAGMGPFPGMTDQYGLVEPQIEALFIAFVALLRRFCRSGLPWGAIDAFEVRMDGREWDRIPVTSNLWVSCECLISSRFHVEKHTAVLLRAALTLEQDEEDFVVFQHGGYNCKSP